MASAEPMQAQALIITRKNAVCVFMVSSKNVGQH
jgi:hypothetical protein